MKISQELISHLKNAKVVGMLTGAGISAESGVPTFRGENGLWNKMKPEELANFDSFIRNPDLVWEWYQYRRKLIEEVKPNPGHYAIARMEVLLPDFRLITQNIDNLHEEAGSQNVIELHGNIHRNYCMECGKRYEDKELLEEFKHLKHAPHCWCGGLIRPDVVWFGEMLPEDSIDRAFEAAVEADVFFSIGTSGVVYPAANLPIKARQNGAYLVEINTAPTEISSIMHEIFTGPAGEILPQIVAEFEKTSIH